MPLLAGWSLGGGVLWQYALDYPDDLASLTMVVPLSPYGFGGTKGAGGEPCFADFAATGGGTAAPEVYRRFAAPDRSEDEPLTSPRVILRDYFGARGNAARVDEEFLLDEVLRTRTGDGFSPGDSTASPNWPGWHRARAGSSTPSRRSGTTPRPSPDWPASRR